jgi:hypothetical protein
MHGSTLALRDLAVRTPVRLLQWAARLQAVGSGSKRWRCAILCIGNLVTSWKQRCRLSCRGGALGSTEALSTDLPEPITALALASQTVETESLLLVGLTHAGPLPVVQILQRPVLCSIQTLELAAGLSIHRHKTESVRLCVLQMNVTNFEYINAYSRFGRK